MTEPIPAFNTSKCNDRAYSEGKKGCIVAIVGVVILIGIICLVSMICDRKKPDPKFTIEEWISGSAVQLKQNQFRIDREEVELAKKTTCVRYDVAIAILDAKNFGLDEVEARSQAVNLARMDLESSQIMLKTLRDERTLLKRRLANLESIRSSGATNQTIDLPEFQ